MLHRGIIVLLVLISPGLAAQEFQSYDECIVHKVGAAGEERPISEIKAECEQFKKEYAMDQRLEEEKETEELPFVLTPHKRNYLLLGYYFNGVNTEPFDQVDPALAQTFEDTEIKFQFSLKFPLAKRFFKGTTDLYAAYTNRSFWQAFDRDGSNAFRETNHEPELWFEVHHDFRLGKFKSPITRFGFVHQSNGRSGTLSRGWNRVYAEFFLESENLELSLKPWIRVSEDDRFDDSIDLQHYLGNFEFEAYYKVKRQVLGLMLRNNLDFSDNKGAIQLDWTFPLYDRIRGYVQYFYGYGESLIDYDYKANTIGIGLMLTDRI